MIKIVDTFDITPDGVCVYNNRWQLVHLRQGDMDGACAVYSLMMYLVSIKVLKYKQVTNLNTSFKGNTSKGRLFKEFFEKEGLCRNGFYFSTITDKLNHSFAKEVNAIPNIYESSKQEQDKALEDIRNSINMNIPIMIAIVRKDGAHAILANGYEEKDGSLTKLFCLDPGYSIQKNCFWNTVIRINEYAHNKYCHECLSPDDSCKVYIDETLQITKK